jgi:hypothetical protein
MTGSSGTAAPPGQTAEPPRSTLLWVLTVALALGVGVMAGLVLRHRITTFLGTGSTRIDQSTVVNRLQSVAKLVTTEAMVRDVVVYRNTWLGSTKRSLVVATGKALVGLDLGTPPEVRVAQQDRHITIRLPAARLVGIEVLELKTWDERSGLWNTFRPADRDTILQLAREQLARAAGDLGVLEHAEASATRFIQALFADQGYTVDVTFPPRPAPSD